MTVHGHYGAALRNLVELDIGIEVTTTLPLVAKTLRLQSLVLDCGSMRTIDDHATLGALLGSLAHLGQTLTSLVILNWGQHDERDPQAIIDALADLPRLERLSLDDGDYFEFEQGHLRQLFVDHKELTHLTLGMPGNEDGFRLWIVASQGLVPRLTQTREYEMMNEVHCDVALLATWLHEHPLYAATEYDNLIMTVRNDIKDAKALGAVLDRWPLPSIGARMAFREVKSDPSTTGAFVDAVVRTLEHNVGRFTSRTICLFFFERVTFATALLQGIPVGIADVSWVFIVVDSQVLTTGVLSRFVASNRCSFEFRLWGQALVTRELRGVAPSFLALSGQSSCATELDLHSVMFADWTETDVENAMDLVSKLPASFTITFRVSQEVGQSPRLRHVMRPSRIGAELVRLTNRKDV